MTRVAAKSFLFFFLTLFWLIAGCSFGDFIGAYFNTFYNAQRQFAEAEDELLSQPDMKQKTSPFGYTFNVAPATKSKFAAVIEKCSKLLQYHPESSLVDDALLMIGKSYYYQNDYQPAERKFRELLDQFPNSSLAEEARLLLGYTYYMMNDREKSVATAKDLLAYADKNGDDDYSAKASVLLAQIEVDHQNIAEAKGYYQTAAEKAGSSEDRSLAYLNLADLLAQEGNSQHALEAYRKAESASSEYRTSYKAQMGQARMLSKLGAHEESLNLLRDLLSNSNYKEFFGDISLEIANVFKANKEYPSAIAQYTYVDTSYARTETAANSYFQLGDLYETRLAQFDSARVTYTRGKSEFPQAAITAQLVKRSDYITKYVQIRNEIHRLDSLKTILLTPPDTTQAQTDTSHLHAASVRDSTAADSLHSRPDTTTVRVQGPPPMPLDSLNARLAYNQTELAGLFFTTMNLPDSAEKWYRSVLIEFPSSPQVPRALFTLAQIYNLDSTRSRTSSDSLYKLIADRYPDCEFAPEAERILGRPVRVPETDPAEARYSRAEKLLGTGDTTAARDTLRAIVAVYPSSPFASKAQYALGWIYESQGGQGDSAVSSYRKLVTLFPRSQYAQLVRPKLDEYDNNKRALEQKAKDSLAATKRDTLLNGKAMEKMPGMPSAGTGDSLRVKGAEKDSTLEQPPDQLKQAIPDTLLRKQKD